MDIDTISNSIDKLSLSFGPVFVNRKVDIQSDWEISSTGTGLIKGNSGFQFILAFENSATTISLEQIIFASGTRLGNYASVNLTMPIKFFN